jgi:Insertion element 4 transposase N-terminal/Transposase DDE domain
LEVQSVITRTISVAAGVFAPGHLGELTQVVDFELVDAVAEETGTVQRRVRLLPTRVVIFFVLALALFEKSAYRQVWGKLVTGLQGIVVAWPSTSALTRARRRVGAKPLRALFEAVSGPVAWPGTAGVFWRGLRTVAIDATSLHVPDSPAIGMRYRKRHGDKLEWGYPLLRLTVLIECGTRALIGAVFGPETDGEAVYACRLLDKLSAGMLLLADAGYDSWRLLADVTATGAQYVCRSGARRTPLILRMLPDGSYLSVLGYGQVKVRIVEAWITVTYADGTVHAEQWRLITSLLEHVRYPAADLVGLYHERWQVETTYLSIKHTILDGRVLRSQYPADIDQEVYALLTVYQAIVRIACDAVASRPGVDPDRASFTIALETARDQVIAAAGILPSAGRTVLVGVIGHVVLNSLLPVRRRQRIKARSRKNPTSKYGPNAGKFPQTAQTYTLQTEVAIMEKGLTARPRR